MQGLIGKKLGMTQVFDGQGAMVPVTMIAVGPCVVIQRKTKEQDGYDAVQLGFEDRREKGVSKAAMGRFKKVSVGPKRYLAEFRIDPAEECKAGDAVSLSVLGDAAFVDVEGVTKGLGFQGVVKRFKMSGGRMTHGGHSKRRVGSIGAKVAPARVHKGKRLPGRTGRVHVKQQNLKVVAMRQESNVLLVKGAVPGPTGQVLLIRKSLKKAGKAS